jgi:hypothetical protein
MAQKNLPKPQSMEGGGGAAAAIGAVTAVAKASAKKAVNREILKRQIGKAAAKGVQATAKINKKDIGAKAAKAVKEQNKAAKLTITRSESAVAAGKKAAETKAANAIASNNKKASTVLGAAVAGASAYRQASNGPVINVRHNGSADAARKAKTLGTASGIDNKRNTKGVR